MRYLLLGLCLLLPFLSLAQDEIEYKEYSYSEFFQMIEKEKSEEFQLSNALIIPDSATDKRFFTYITSLETDRPMKLTPEKDTIVIEKAIRLDNVQFLIDGPGTGNSNAGLSYLHFKKPVRLTDVLNVLFTSSTFDEELWIAYRPTISNITSQPSFNFNNSIVMAHCHFKNGLTHFFSPYIFNQSVPISLFLNSSDISTPTNAFTYLTNGKFSAIGIFGNRFSGLGRVDIENNGAKGYAFKNNSFEAPIIQISQSEIGNFYFDFSDNTFKHYVGLKLGALSESGTLNWSQFANKSLSSLNLYSGLESVRDSSSRGSLYTLENLRQYANKTVVENELYYKEAQKLKGFLMRFYKSQNDNDYANAVYVESKDLETKRLAYLYQQDPHFNTFFKWKINQFLKVFSSYGTEPSKAIVFSVYVILAFAIVYLFFPNYWDSHGKNRIMDRYRFFLKYVNKDSGMHEVYLDEKKPELLASEDFKVYLQEQGKTAPKFFMATALPLYRWSVAGTKSFSWLLSKVDVLKGKWSDTEDAKKGGKSILLIGAFLIALLYDIFIKMLNALMLSINTFTTLGFGEIPIKGLPRYLAIIQGFIGWFMLTIFSVSLISQLLN